MKKFTRVGSARYGLVMYNHYDTFIGRSIEFYGEWAQGEVSLWEQLIQPGWTVLDVGANIGTLTLALASLVGPSGKVLAFEPQRIPYYMLAGNVALNSLTNVWCYNNAVSDEQTTIFVPELDVTQYNNYGLVELQDKTYENIQGQHVPTIRIDDLQLTNCHFIKIDVEGMEDTVLRGATKTIGQFRPVIYVENNRKEKRDALVRHIDELGYHMFWHHSPIFNPDNYYENSNNVWEMNGADLCMICFPKEANLEVTGFQKVDVPVE